MHSPYDWEIMSLNPDDVTQIWMKWIASSLSPVNYSDAASCQMWACELVHEEEGG